MNNKNENKTQTDFLNTKNLVPFSIKDGFSHIKIVKELIESIQTNINNLKKKKIILSEEVKHLSTQLKDNTDDIKSNIQPILENINLNFKTQIDNQIIENKKLQQLIIELKKEKSVLQNRVIQYAKKCGQLEQDLGRYPREIK